MLRVGLYARVSTHDQKTLPLRLLAMRDYAKKRGWAATVEVQELADWLLEQGVESVAMESTHVY